mmetsp:Transcript_33987/g.100159  ORF Transcript_33987/g.100159 Transcript_33987/m.100159 type:complete len:343 (-) Transcript_33987:385-1413(-)
MFSGNQFLEPFQLVADIFNACLAIEVEQINLRSSMIRNFSSTGSTIWALCHFNEHQMTGGNVVGLQHCQIKSISIIAFNSHKFCSVPQNKVYAVHFFSSFVVFHSVDNMARFIPSGRISAIKRVAHLPRTKNGCIAYRPSTSLRSDVTTYYRPASSGDYSTDRNAITANGNAEDTALHMFQIYSIVGVLRTGLLAKSKRNGNVDQVFFRCVSLRQVNVVQNKVINITLSLAVPCSFNHFCNETSKLPHGSLFKDILCFGNGFGTSFLFTFALFSVIILTGGEEPNVTSARHTTCDDTIRIRILNPCEDGVRIQRGAARNVDKYYLPIAVISCGGLGFIQAIN